MKSDPCQTTVREVKLGYVVANLVAVMRYVVGKSIKDVGATGKALRTLPAHSCSITMQHHSVNKIKANCSL